MNKALARRISELRKRAGYTNQEAFAWECGISRTQYARYEIGEVDIRWSTLEKIIQKLGVSVPEFFAEGFEF